VALSALLIVDTNAFISTSIPSRLATVKSARFLPKTQHEHSSLHAIVATGPDRFNQTASGNPTAKEEVKPGEKVFEPAAEDEVKPSENIFEPIGKGILRDYKARLPLFASDIKDGLNVQVNLRTDVTRRASDSLAHVEIISVSCSNHVSFLRLSCASRGIWWSVCSGNKQCYRYGGNGFIYSRLWCNVRFVRGAAYDNHW
jgi:hypothetical protein